MADAILGEKTCSACKRVLPIESFSRIRRTGDARRARCKQCCKWEIEYYRRTNADTIQAQRLAYYDANSEKCRAASTQWRANNLERAKVKELAYDKRNRAARRTKAAVRRRANLEKYLAIEAAYRAAHVEEVRARSLDYAKRNPERARLAAHRRRAMKRAAGGKLSIGISKKLFALQKGKCACCGVDLTKVVQHLDHIHPLSKGGPNEDRNMQLLCRSCNEKKHNKLPHEFMQSLGFLL